MEKERIRAVINNHCRLTTELTEESLIFTKLLRWCWKWIGGNSEAENEAEYYQLKAIANEERSDEFD